MTTTIWGLILVAKKKNITPKSTEIHEEFMLCIGLQMYVKSKMMCALALLLFDILVAMCTEVSGDKHVLHVCV